MRCNLQARRRGVPSCISNRFGWSILNRLLFGSSRSRRCDHVREQAVSRSHRRTRAGSRTLRSANFLVSVNFHLSLLRPPKCERAECAHCVNTHIHVLRRIRVLMQLAGKRASRSTSGAATGRRGGGSRCSVLRSSIWMRACNRAWRGYTLRQLPGVPAPVIHRRNVHPSAPSTASIPADALTAPHSPSRLFSPLACLANPPLALLDRSIRSNSTRGQIW